ncbi:MAG: HAMP domain-containing protein, partial [Ignavibacteriales bacterium]|nr:HAMP domain-containing protein [Ignavibacteriales bacterium]
MRDIRNKIIITSAVVLVFIIGFAYFTSKRFAKPIRTMAIIAEQIRSGNLKSRIPTQSTTEFDQLAGALNTMVDKLEEDIEKLKRLERVRSEFLGNVSHELRTPIFTIQGMLETLLGGAIDDGAVNREFVERALKNTQRLNTLLTDLIEISRIETGDMKMSFRYFNLYEFLTQIVNEMQEAANQNNVTLRFES